VQRREHNYEQGAGDESPAERSSTAMRKVREEGADEVEVDDRLVRHGREGVAPIYVRRAQVGATVAAVLAGGNGAVAMRAGDERRAARAGDILRGAAAGSRAPFFSWLL
jgi:NADPH-dependent ferric siderophore reductase